ncbi:3156_t:CDS:2 [Entrophospora sp. SA101]|nr:3156_t:CDS:2 [Entrophospora sp. SA101]
MPYSSSDRTQFSNNTYFPCTLQDTVLTLAGIGHTLVTSLLAIESRLMDPDEAIHDDARLPLPDLSFNFFEKQFDGLENKDVRIHTLNHIHNAVNQR